jgi:CHAT domain-containing protein
MSIAVDIASRWGRVALSLFGIFALATAHASDVTNNPALAVDFPRVIEDDFARADRESYRLIGPATWNDEGIAVAPDEGVQRRVAIGPNLRLKLALDWPEGESRSRLTLLTDRGAVICQFEKTDQRVIVTILRPVDRNGETHHVPLTIREYAELPDAIELTYRHGLIRIAANASETVAGYFGHGAATVRQMGFVSQQGEFQLRGLTVDAVPPEELTDEQRTRLQEVEHILIEADRLYHNGLHVEGDGEFTHAVDLMKEVLGPDHHLVAQKLYEIGVHFRIRGRHLLAIPRLEASLEITERHTGPRHPILAARMNELAENQIWVERRDEAEALLVEARSIAEEVFGKPHIDTIRYTENLAWLHQVRDQYSEAETLCHDILKSKHVVFGLQHAEVAVTLSELAQHCRDQGKRRESIDYFVQSIDMREHLGLGEHADVPPLLFWAGQLSREVGDLDQAEHYLQRSIALTEKLQGPNSPELALDLEQLAIVHRLQGRLGDAKPILDRAVRILEQVESPAAASLVPILREQAQVAVQQGAYPQAEAAYRKALAILEQEKSQNPAEVSRMLRLLGALYRMDNRLADARPILERALELRVAAFGPHDPQLTSLLNSLAVVTGMLGDYERTESLLRQALEISRAQQQPDPGLIAILLGNLGRNFEEQGQLTESLDCYTQALDHCVASLGERDPATQFNRKNLSRLYFQASAFDESREMAEEYLRLELQMLNETLPGLAAAEVWTLLAHQGPDTDLWLSAAAVAPSTDPASVYSQLWAIRSVVSRTLARRPLPNTDDPSVRLLAENLSQTRRQLAELVLSSTDESAEGHAAAKRERLQQLNDQKEELERELARASQSFEQQHAAQHFTPADLAKHLNGSTVFVDIVRVAQSTIEPGQPDSYAREDRYHAFVLKKSDEAPGWSVAWVPLGAADRVDAHVAKWRATFDPSQPTQFNRPGRHPAELRALIWQPLEKHLDGYETVILSPDGDLHFLPWAALPGRRAGAFLIEDHALGMAPGAWMMAVLLHSPEPEAGRPLIAGGVNYGLAAPGEDLDAVRAVWQELPATAQEAQSIAALWPNSEAVRFLSNELPTEDVLRTHLPEASYVHLATHGFFADERFRSALQIRDQNERLFEPGPEVSIAGLTIGANDSASQVTASVRNPLVLSGLVCAGANPSRMRDEQGLPIGADGILTAEEIIGLDLSSTNLVALSACETGLGRVADGEGVMGLRRAFHIAGARSVVASQWKVSDEATQALMTEFYTNLWTHKLPRLEALRRAQLAMLRGFRPGPQALTLRGEIAPLKIQSRGLNEPAPEALGPIVGPDARRPLPPFYWAAFSLSGDWR